MTLRVTRGRIQDTHKEQDTCRLASGDPSGALVSIEPRRSPKINSSERSRAKIPLANSQPAPLFLHQRLSSEFLLFIQFLFLFFQRSFEHVPRTSPERSPRVSRTRMPDTMAWRNCIAGRNESGTRPLTRR